MTPSVDEAAHRAATSDLNLIRKPTRGQTHAGNYAMGHVRVAGLDITIENPAGSRRRPEWPPMKDHYGYVRGSIGADGDHVDIFLKPGVKQDWDGNVYVVDQFRPDGSFDEHKCLLGYNTSAEAAEAYLSNYQSGWKLGPVTTMALPAFKEWVKSPAATAPVSQAAYAKVDLSSVIRKAFVLKYSDDEPRDDIGRWTDGGGSSSTGASNESSARTETGAVQDTRGLPGSTVGVASSSGPSAETLSRPLDGLPDHAVVPGLGKIQVGPYVPARQAAYDYMRKAGMPYDPPKNYVKVDPERAARIAQAYTDMKHDPQDPKVKAAYDAMIGETLSQFQAIRDTGLKIDFIDYAKTGDPYAASPRLATEDVRNNNHLWVFPTSAGFGSGDSALDVKDNPLLAKTGITIGGHELLANDVFRITHDYFGHIKEGNGFRADGEENAWRSHSAMYSDLARQAMTSETRGQNSWVNYGPHGQTNRTANSSSTVFADQKTGLMPEWTMTDGAKDVPIGKLLKAAARITLRLLSKEFSAPTSATSGIQPYGGAKARVQHREVDDRPAHKKKRKPRRKPRPSIYQRGNA